MSTYDIPAPIEPQPWQKDALCAQVDPELWFHHSRIDQEETA